MGKQLSTRIVASSFAAMMMLARGASAGAPTPTTTTTTTEAVELSCDTTVLEPELGARVQAQLTAELARVLAGSGNRLDRGADRTVEVRVIGFDADRRDYTVEIEILATDEVWGPVAVSCEACSERRLVTSVAEQTAQLMNEASQSSLDPRGQEDQQEDPVVPRPAMIQDRDQDQANGSGSRPNVDNPSASRRRLEGLGISGAVLLSAGVTACATGTYLLVHGVERSSDPTRHRATTVDFRPAGVSTLVAGAVAAGVGAALLGVDLRRNGERQGRVALQMTPRYVGLQFRRRF